MLYDTRGLGRIFRPLNERQTVSKSCSNANSIGFLPKKCTHFEIQLAKLTIKVIPSITAIQITIAPVGQDFDISPSGPCE